MNALISFQKLEMGDLCLMHRWLNTDFVQQWYGKRAHSYEQIAQKYAPRIRGQAPTDCFLILFDSMPVGYIQTYKISDNPDYSKYVQVDENAAGVDLFIGASAYIHRGLGAIILKQFLQEIVFGKSDAVSCIVGPEPKNTIAIRAYEKAGFKYLKTIQIPDEGTPEYLMRISRADLG